MEASNTVADFPVACDAGTETGDGAGKVVTAVVRDAAEFCWEDIRGGDLPVFGVGAGDDDLDKKMAWRWGSGKGQYIVMN